MKFRSLLFSFCYISTFLTPLFTHAAADDGFRSLFNGKDLSGWDGRKGLWAVENGAIVGSTQVKLERNTFLIWKGGDVGDFVLKLKMKFAGGNSGIQYRAKVDDAAKHFVPGNQCDIHPKPVKVAKADVKSVTASPVSQMPPGLINSLNENELADLVAYLLSGANNRPRVYK